MSSSFSGLGIGLSALLTQRIGVDVSGHNVANANTPGYSRQDVLLAARLAHPGPFTHWRFDAGQIGTGVQVQRIRRLRDAFVDMQLRLQEHSLARQQVNADVLARLEQIVAEPGDKGLGEVLNQLWNAWDEVGNAPQSSGARANLLGRSQQLASRLNQMHDQLLQLRGELDDRLVDKAAELNEIADQVADLNLRIKNVIVSGDQPNDLMDQRDLLLDRLSRLTAFNTLEGEHGQVSVYFGGRALVDDTRANHVATQLGASGYQSLVWADGASTMQVGDGELKGLVVARDDIVARRVTELNSLASAIIDTVNLAHRTGYGLDGSTGLDFFTGSGANDIAMSSALLTSPSSIAAARQADASGDGSLALSIGASRNQAVAALGSVSADAYYQSLVSRLGMESRTAADGVASQEMVVSSLERQRESTTGVSLDEEATNLIRYQQAYAAAAQYIAVVNELLDHLINVVGAAAG